MPGNDELAHAESEYQRVYNEYRAAGEECTAAKAMQDTAYERFNLARDEMNRLSRELNNASYKILQLLEDGA